MRRRAASAAGVVLALAALALLCRSRAGELEQVLAVVPIKALLLLTALHVLTLLARSEAWRLTLAAVEGHVLPRRAVHGSNGGAFLVGSLEAHSALAARVLLLRHLAGPRAPRADQILLSDAPILLLEICATALILCLATPLAALLLAAALVILAAGGRISGRLRGLRILRDGRRLAALTAWVGAFTGLAVARVTIALAACGIAPTPERVSTAFAAAGLYGLLPLGPGAPAAATVTAAGTGGAPLAAGLVLAATSVTAVILYALANLKGTVPFIFAPRRFRESKGARPL